MDPINPASGDVEYEFNRPVCLGWTVFGLACVVGCLIVAVVAGDQMFARGLVPGWLFGSFGASLFSVMAISWARRFLHSGPALILSESGIRTDKRLGGFTTPRIDGSIPWEEVEWASVGAHGSVILQLRDPDAFWAHQSLRSRIMAWHPWPRRHNMVSLGGNDLAATAADVASTIQARSDWIALERPSSPRSLPDPPVPDEG